MKEVELKPCPFCGGEAEVIDTHVYLDMAILIRCLECQCVTKRILINHPAYNANGLDESTRYTREQAVDKAIELWNSRSRHERWQLKPESGAVRTRRMIHVCSGCGASSLAVGTEKYCSECGARMDGGKG